LTKFDSKLEDLHLVSSNQFIYMNSWAIEFN